MLKTIRKFVLERSRDVYWGAGKFSRRDDTREPRNLG